MRIVPIRVWGDTSGLTAENRSSIWVDESIPASQKKTGDVLAARYLQPLALNKILSSSRIIVLEGIAGSGKDTFQKYLKSRLRDRVVYDYSEGELLLSWNQLQIKGIRRLRVRFMRFFVNYVRDILTQDENAVFLLNRFHLSAYVMTILKEPKLEAEYNAIINVLRTLSVHVFILQLDENEIEKRSLHPERSGAWEKFQHQIVKKDGFRDRVERYIWQQRLMLAAAERQQIPYSVFKCSSAPEVEGGWVRVPGPQRVIRRGIRLNAADAEVPQNKRGFPRNF